MTSKALSAKQLRLARISIRSIDSSLETQYLTVMKFLARNPNYRGKLKGKNPPKFGTENYFAKTALGFSRGRIIPEPRNSGKTTDPLLIELFGKMNPLSKKDLKIATNYHGDFMVIENKIGKILEKYLAASLEPIGWVWCSGDFVDKVDFIYPSTATNFQILQVKNKDVTENSSSSAGRAKVPKWARLKGKNATPNWDNFPNSKARKILSEKDFLSYGAAIGSSWFQSKDTRINNV